MRAFYVAHEGEDFDTLQVRFGFQSQETADLFVNYLDEMIDYFLVQNATYDLVALSSLMNQNW